MNQTTDYIAPIADLSVLKARPPRVAVICALWHYDIVASARDAAVTEFSQHGISADQLDHFQVPGAFEIPLYAKKLAYSGRYEAIIACALVVNGGIYRHDFVAAAVIDGLMQVQIDTDVPVLSAVLTPHDFHDHDDHHQFFKQHFVKKGIEVAQAGMQTMVNLRAIDAA